MSKYVITEGVESTWHYHISEEATPTRSLCDKWTMRTNLPMEKWGTVTEHIKEKYCSECYRIYKEKQ
jgi:hypothetical protein